MGPSLLALLLAFPPFTSAKDIAPHHFGTPHHELTEASVATLGGEAWVFWVDTRRDVSLGVDERPRADLWMAPIGPDGEPLEALPRVGCLAPPGVTFSKPRAVAVGSGLLVAWLQRTQATGAPAIRLAALDANGALACPDTPRFTPPTLVDLALASNGTSALLAWSNPAGIDVREVDGAGLQRANGLNSLLLPGSGGRPAVAGADGGYVVSWVAFDGGVLSQELPASGAPLVTGPGSAVALLEAGAGTVQGFIKGTSLYLRVLPSAATMGAGPAIALPTAKDLLLAPWPADPDAVVAFGWSTPGSATWSLGVPGQTFQAAREYVSQHQPLAATAFQGGVLSVGQQVGAAPPAPLATFALAPSSNGTTPDWDGGTRIADSANQWAPTVVWANSWWMVGHDEASEPTKVAPEFHQWRLDPDGTLVEAPWVNIEPTLYRQLLTGGGRIAVLGVLNGESTITALTHAGDQYSPGDVIARAPEAFRFGAINAADTLQWAVGASASFTSRHAVEGRPLVETTQAGVPGRCAAVIDRSFFLPVWNGPTLSLVAFESTGFGTPTSRVLQSFQIQGQPACAAAHGSRVLVTWAHGTGLGAVVLDTATGQVAPVSLPPTDSGDVAPVAAATTEGWVLAWEARDAATGRSTIHGTFVTLAGAGDLQVTKLGLDTVHSELRPALASAPTGQAALAWSTFDEGSGQTVTRVRVIGEAVQPDGGALLPDGGTLLPDGGTLLPDGGTLLPDGGTLLPDGGTLPPDGGAGSGDLVHFESCGCHTASPASLLALLAAVALRRRGGRARPA